MPGTLVIHPIPRTLGVLLLFLSLAPPSGARERALDPFLAATLNARPETLVGGGEILAAFEAGSETTSVIVTLRQPAEAASIRWSERSALAAHHQRTAAAAEGVISRVADGRLTVARRFQNFAGFAGEVDQKALASLLADPEVLAVEPDRLLTPHLRQGIPLMNASGVRATYNGQGIAIAVCDSGIEASHPMLGGAAFPNAKIIGGYDFGDNDGDPSPNGAHGTACAGIAAGTLADTGDYIGGVAHGARLYDLKIVNSQGNAPGSALIAAWDWCVTHRNDDPANPILVISTSYGGGQYFTPCDQSVPGMAAVAAAVKSAGITAFASSGNDGFCTSITWPACIASVNAVGAFYDADLGTNSFCVTPGSCTFGSNNCGQEAATTGKVAGYSNSASMLDFFAPGDNCHTTTTGGGFATVFSGTSAACPYAAGAAACAQSAALALIGRHLSPDEVRWLFNSTGTSLTDSKSSITKPSINLGLAIEWLYTYFPPANDNFASAATIQGHTGSISGFNNNASSEAGEPAHAGVTGGRSAWYSWTAPFTGRATFTTAGSGFDTLLGVYTGSAVNALAYVAANDNAVPNTTSLVIFDALAGSTYRIAVDGKNGAQGALMLYWSLRPGNDDFANAYTASGSSGQAVGSNQGAGKQSGEPNHAGNAGGASVWWKWTAPAGGTTTITTAGSPYDTLLAVYTGGAVNGLSLVAQNNDAAPGIDTTSSVTFTATSGVTYRIAVDGFAGATGPVTLNWIGQPAPTPSPTGTPLYNGRAVGDFDNSGCTNLADFLFLLDNWMVVVDGTEIGLADFLALLDNWTLGPGCP